MQLVVPSAVRNAVSAATITFTASSMILCFFIISSLSFLSHRFHRFHRFSFFIKNSRIREFFCNDKNFCFAMNLRIVSRRRVLCHTDSTDFTDFLFIKN